MKKLNIILVITASLLGATTVQAAKFSSIFNAEHEAETREDRDRKREESTWRWFPTTTSEELKQKRDWNEKVAGNKTRKQLIQQLVKEQSIDVEAELILRQKEIKKEAKDRILKTEKRLLKAEKEKKKAEKKRAKIRKKTLKKMTKKSLKALRKRAKREYDHRHKSSKWR
jgi:endo-beta-N-acetylglucosaminidase D